MKMLLKTVLIAAGAAAAAAAVTALLMPAQDGTEKKKIIYGRNVAHRGLHDKRGETPENSLAAFRAAAEAGYGAEMDARLTSDEVVVVFHDDRTGRMCGEDRLVSEMDFTQLRALRLQGTNEQIPTLHEALDTINGCGPIILELKTAGARNALLCEKVLEIIRGYSGDLCIESFDPRIVAWFRKNAPEILRGQLTDSFQNMKKGTSPLFAFAIANGLTNVIARPHFIAHGPGKKSPLIRLAEKLGAMPVYWTAHNIGRQVENDAVIFEYYRPLPKFK